MSTKSSALIKILKEQTLLKQQKEQRNYELFQKFVVNSTPEKLLALLKTPTRTIH